MKHVAKNSLAVVLSLWIVFMSMGLTVYVHVCHHTGNVQVSVNEPVECEHMSELTHKPDAKNCKHHCHKSENQEEKEEKNCCDKSEYTFYIKIEEKSQTSVQIKPNYVFTAFNFVSPNTINTLTDKALQSNNILVKPPDLHRTSFDLLLQKESYLI